MKNRLSNHDLEVFSKLYDETVMENTRISKDAFLACVGNEAGQSDLSRMYPMENKDFLYAVYESLFYRMPDAVTEKKWEAEAESLEKEEFRTKLVHQVLGSEEHRIKNVSCSHNIYAPFFTGTASLGNMYRREEIKVKLKAVLKKMPFDIYGKLKNLLGK